MSSDTSKMVATMWSRRVEDFHRSGLTQRQYCVQNGLKTSTLQRWVEKFKKELSPPKKGVGPTKASATETEPGFSKVVTKPTSQSQSSSKVGIYFPSGLRIECQQLPSVDWLKSMGALR